MVIDANITECCSHCTILVSEDDELHVLWTVVTYNMGYFSHEVWSSICKLTHILPHIFTFLLHSTVTARYRVHRRSCTDLSHQFSLRLSRRWCPNVLCTAPTKPISQARTVTSVMTSQNFQAHRFNVSVPRVDIALFRASRGESDPALQISSRTLYLLVTTCHASYLILI